MAPEWKMQSYTFKTVGDCKLQADGYQVERGKRQPAIVWIHGGALIAGSRAWIAPYQLRRYLEAGFTVIAIDYRLAPETKLPGIIADLEDAFHWLGEQGNELLRIDPERISVVGHSAGGYLAQMAGFCVKPQPKAIVSFYGYSDIIAAWYSQPDPFYREQGLVPKELAYASVGKRPLTEGDWGERSPFYLYCRQNGLWPREVGGQDPQKDPGWFSRYCPIQNVTSRYPPALLIHGDRDTDVPYGQSVEMDAVLEKQQVEHQFLTLKGTGHGFDGASDAHENPMITRIFDQVVDFLKRHCQ